MSLKQKLRFTERACMQSCPTMNLFDTHQVTLATPATLFAQAFFTRLYHSVH